MTHEDFNFSAGLFFHTLDFPVYRFVIKIATYTGNYECCGCVSSSLFSFCRRKSGDMKERGEEALVRTQVSIAFEMRVVDVESGNVREPTRLRVKEDEDLKVVVRA